LHCCVLNLGHLQHNYAVLLMGNVFLINHEQHNIYTRNSVHTDTSRINVKRSQDNKTFTFFMLKHDNIQSK